MQTVIVDFHPPGTENFVREPLVVFFNLGRGDIKHTVFVEIGKDGNYIV